MNINILPDDCLRLILIKFTLHELIQFRLVCHQWLNLIELMFLEGKQALKLFGSRSDIAMFTEAIDNCNASNHIDFSMRQIGPVDDVLVIKPGFAIQACHSIPKLFPSITKLLICCKHLFESESFHEMLREWPDLVGLTLSAKMQHMPREVLCAINSLKSLKRLHLTQLFQSKIPDQLPILAQLEHFTLAQYACDAVPVLAQLGPSCQELSLCWVFLGKTELERLLKLNDQLTKSVTNLKIGFIATNHENRMKNYYRMFQLICDRFSALTRLNITFTDNLPLSLLVPQLAKLSSLNHLEVYISVNELGIDQTHRPHLPPLTTVKILYLEIYNISIGQFLQWIAPLFPKAQQLIIKCDYENQKDCDNFQLKCLNDKVFPDLVFSKLRHQ